MDARRSFWLIWTGQAVSLTGSQAVQFSLIWWLTIQTRDARVVTLATALGLLPQVLLGPFIGVLVDRLNRKRVLWFSDAGIAAASAALALLFGAGLASPFHVLAVLFLRALGTSFHTPAMIATTTLMVGKSDLIRVQGLNQSLQGLLRIVGPPLGALLVGYLAMSPIMWIDVITALAALLPLTFVTVPQPESRIDRSGRAQRVMQGFLQGLRFLADRSGLFQLVLMSAAINLFLVPAFSLLPLLVERLLGGGAAELAWLSSAFGAGMFLGGVAVGFKKEPENRIVQVLLAIGGVGFGVLALGVVPLRLPLLALLLLLVGLMAPFANAPVQVILQTTIPLELQGRVFALISSLAGITTPLGLAIAGFSAEWIGIRNWYLAAGLTCLCLALAGRFSRALRELHSQ